jgi:plasmid stabilization system protein ParE
MKLVWSPLAVERALEAKAYIASDNPRTADKWASGLVSAVSKLKRHPKLGRVVPEIGLEEYRELVYGNYRVVYRISANNTFVMTVRHFARHMDLDELEPESLGTMTAE